MLWRLFLATALLTSNFAATGSSETIRILFTNNANGKLADCNCPNDPYGGLGERVALIREYRSYYKDILLLDSGGYLGLSETGKRGEAVLRLMDIMGYDAYGIGDQELYRGLGRFLDRYGAVKDRTICSTVFAKDGTQVFDPWRILTVHGIKIGVAGITSAETFRFLPKENRDFIATGPDSALAVIVPVMRKQCDLVIVLSQLGREGDTALAERVHGIDIIIGGHSQTLIDKPIKSGGCMIVQAGKGGGHVGEMLVRFDSGKVSDISYKLIEVSNRYTIPADIVTLLTEEYNIDIP